MVERNVTNIHIHPKWKPYIVEYDADMAILDLSDKVTFTNYIQPICMPVTVSVVDNIEGSIVGWGIADKETVEHIPQYTMTKILNATYCYKRDPPIVIYSSANTFCGGEGYGAPSKGDSGGGLFGIANFTWVQYGIISAVRTNETGHVSRSSFAVYTNIYLFMDWIVETAKMNENMSITLTCRYGPKYFSVK